MWDMAINDILDKIITVLSTALPAVNISIGDPRQDPPALYPHINIFSVRSNHVGARTTHQIFIGIGIKNPAISVAGKVIKYNGFYDAISLLASVKDIILDKSKFIGIEFFDEHIETVDMHGIYAIKLTLVCQEVNSSKGY